MVRFYYSTVKWKRIEFYSNCMVSRSFLSEVENSYVVIIIDSFEIYMSRKVVANVKIV